MMDLAEVKDMNNANTARKIEPKVDPKTEALDAVVREIAKDANDQPASFLKDTIVPAGGE